jgi:LacI family transcriptional regulator
LTRPTIYDVASRAGVSITTVSHALNKPHRVGAATLQRVLAAIDDLGFTPKADAVSQARKGVGRIGVLAPFTAYASYRDRLAGVLRGTESQSSEVVVFDQPSANFSTAPLLSSLPTTGRLDGLLVMGLPLDESMARRLIERDLPTVLVDSLHADFCSVNVDDEAGGRLVGERFAARGYRRIAYVSEQQKSLDYLSPGQLRIRGLVRALRAAGGSGDVPHVIIENSLAGARRAAIEMVATGSVPEAILAHYDDLAAGLVTGFRSAGLRVPEDVAVVGYDDGRLAEALDITTVRQPFVESGRLATALLLDRLGGHRDAVQHVTLPGQLVVRGTA